MFSGLISRWTMPASCAAARALATWIATSTSFIRSHRPARKTLTQRLAVDQFAGNIVSGVILADLVNRQDIWMIEPDYSARFLLKPLQALPSPVKRVGRSLSAALRPAVMSVAR